MGSYRVGSGPCLFLRGDPYGPFLFRGHEAMSAEKGGTAVTSRRLALDAIRASYSPSALGRVDIVSGAMWHGLIELAAQEGALPAIAACIIDARGASAIDSAPILEFLRYFKETAAQENEGKFRVLSNTVNVLASVGVENIVLKGAAFLVAPFSSRSRVRSMADVDLLLKPHQSARAITALRRAGYYSLEPIDWYQASDHHHAAPLSDPTGTTPIELHFRLLFPRRKNPIPTDILFRDATLRSFGGADFLIPAHEHRVAHLIAHAFVSNHGYRLLRIALRDLMDLMELDRAQSIDWDKVRGHFDDINYEKQAAGFLMAAERLLTPAFQAPRWAEQGHAWAKLAAEAYFHPKRFRGRRVFGQLVGDLAALIENAEHRRLVFRMLSRSDDLKKLAERYMRLC
jgi:hypothetical protein